MPLADPFYYLGNFQRMIDTLESRDGDLLESEERDFMVDFARLPQCSRALLVRMIMRKGALFRASRLVYPEIADMAGALAPLLAMHWVEDCPALTLEDLFRLTPKAELAQHLGLPRHLASKPKSTVLATLRAEFSGQRPLLAWCEISQARYEASPGRCAGSNDTIYRLIIDRLSDRLRLIFFGNFRQTLTEFVLADLGIFKFEIIRLHADSRPFRTRRQVNDFLQLYECREMLKADTDPADIERAVPPPIVDCEWLEQRRQKLRFQIARAHERAGASLEALKIYSTCSYPAAGVRAARIRRKLDGVAGRRTQRKRAGAPEFTLIIDRPATGRSVERLVRDHLGAGDDTCVYYVENALINSLFGLLCWPAVFAPVQGAFFHAFHHGPADLSSVGFFERRERQFAHCLAELRSDSYKDSIRRHFAEKSGMCSPFVAWGLVNETLLETALQCFPAAHLTLWFEWMLRDITANRTGFPDLVQFWPSSSRYRLIEVKGPGDRLQNNQHRCLEFCMGNDIPISVCHVQWRGAEVRAGEAAA